MTDRMFWTVALGTLLALAVASHLRPVAAAVEWECKPAYERLAIQATQTAVERDEWWAKAMACIELCEKGSQWQP